MTESADTSCHRPGTDPGHESSAANSADASTPSETQHHTSGHGTQTTYGVNGTHCPRCDSAKERTISAICDTCSRKVAIKCIRDNRLTKTGTSH